MADARSWLKLEGGRDDDFQMGGLSAGTNLNPDWVLRGNLNQSSTRLPDDAGQVLTSQLGGGIRYFAPEYWDLSLDANGGADSSGLRFGGGTVALRGNTGDAPLKAGILVIGGTMHFQFAPGESLRQNSGGLGLNVDLGEHVSLSLSGDQFAYNRQLYGASETTTTSNNGPGGLLGVLQPIGLAPSSTTTTNRGTRDPLLPGFPRRDWTVGVTFELGHGTRLGSDYYQAEIIETGLWTKIASAFWRQEFGEDFATNVSWSKAVENGAYSPFFGVALTWYFAQQGDAEDEEEWVEEE